MQWPAKDEAWIGRGRCSCQTHVALGAELDRYVEGENEDISEQGQVSGELRVRFRSGKNSIKTSKKTVGGPHLLSRGVVDPVLIIAAIAVFTLQLVVGIDSDAPD